MSEKNKRINYIDAAKGIGIIIIVAGHAFTNHASTKNVSYIHLLEFAAQFQIPLFFFLSGLVLSDRHLSHPRQGSLHKTRSLYLPWVGYNLLAACLYNLFARLHIYPEAHSLQEIAGDILYVFAMRVQPICGAMWFVRALLIVSLIFIWLNALLSRIFRLSGPKLELAMCCFTAAFFTLGHLPLCPGVFSIPAAMTNFVYFYLGYLYQKYDFNPLIAKRKSFFLVAGFAINLFFAMNFTFGISGKGEFPGIIFYAVTSLSGILMVLALSQFCRVAENRLLLFIGRQTMAIMALHFICFKAVSIIIIHVYQLELSHMEDIPVVFTDFPFIWYLAYLLTGIAVPCLFGFLLRRASQILKRSKAS